MKFWQHILDKLQDHKKTYVLTVIENFGSSPGRKGFKMLVAQDGFIFGSVGGGVMEFSLVTEAQKLLATENPPTFIKKQIHKGNITNGSGMICSGEQTVAFHYLNSENTTTIEQILGCLQNGEKGTLNLSPTSFDFSDEHLETNFEYKITTNENWFFKEHLGFKETVYIVGGGHVGVALSEVLAKLGFYIVVFDNRKNLNTLENNIFAHKKLVIDYTKIDKHIRQENTSYVAIMTNTYTDDKLVLSKLIKNNYNYIGVLGSTAKLKTMWTVLLKEGIAQETLNTVYAPIGLSIKSETPEEIAVSIAAQIIQVKNKEKN